MISEINVQGQCGPGLSKGSQISTLLGSAHQWYLRTYSCYGAMVGLNWPRKEECSFCFWNSKCLGLLPSSIASSWSKSLMTRYPISFFQHDIHSSKQTKDDGELCHKICPSRKYGQIKSDHLFEGKFWIEQSWIIFFDFIFIVDRTNEGQKKSENRIYSVPHLFFPLGK